MNETRNFTLARKIPMACRNCPAAAQRKEKKVQSGIVYDVWKNKNK
jgi:hypothetical protein